MTDYNFIIIYSTTPSEEVALTISNILISKKLAACVNILSPVKSVYSWENKVCQDIETPFIIKSKSSFFAKIAEIIREKHPYDTPCIVSLPINNIEEKFSSWMISSLNPP